MRPSHFPGLCCEQYVFVSYLEYISETVTLKPIWTDFSFVNIEKKYELVCNSVRNIECRNYDEQVVEPASCLAVLNTFSGFVVLG